MFILLSENGVRKHKRKGGITMITFSDQEIQELESCYKETRNKKVHIVLLRAKRVKRKDIVDMFCINKQTVTNYCHLYKEEGLKGLLVNNYKGRQCYLTKDQIQEVENIIDDNFYKVKDVKKFIEDKFGIIYSSGGISEFVRCLGYVKKKRSNALEKQIQMPRRNLSRILKIY